MPLPTGGTLSLQSYSRPGDATPSKPKQAMIVRMSPETFDALQDQSGRPTMEVAFGPKPGIYIGDTFFSMAPSKENAEHELYLRSTSAAKPNAPLKLHAIVTGKFRVERQINDSIEDKIRHRTQVAETQRTERKVLMLDAPLELARTKKRKALPASSMMLKKAAHNDHVRNTSTAASALPSRVASPLPSTPTTPTFVMPPTPKESPVRRRMVQYLALSPRTTEEVMRAVGGADCDPSTRRQLAELLDEVAEQDPNAAKGDKSPRQWTLKSTTWLEVRPYEWKLSESERTGMGRSARLIFKSMKVPESHPIWEHVRYRKTSLAVPAHSPSSSRPGTPTTSTSAAGSSSLSSSATAPDAKRGVMSKDVKEKKAKAKSDAPKPKARPASLQVKDESTATASSSKLSSGASGRSKEQTETASETAYGPPTRRLPGSANAAKVGTLPAKPSTTQDSPLGNAAAATLRKPPASADLPRPSPREKERERESAGASSRPKLVPPTPTQTSSEKERKSSAPSTMRIQKKVPTTVTEPASADRERDQDRRSEKEREKELERKAAKIRERERERGKERETPPTATIKRKKLAQDDDGHESDASRRGGISKKRRTEEGVLPVINASVSAPSTLSTASSRESQPRLDLSLPKKPVTDLSRQKIPRAGSPMIPRASLPPPSHNASTSTLASNGTGVSSSSTSRPRAPSVLEKDRGRELERPVHGPSGSTSTVLSNGSAKPRRRSPIYTSSEDEGEITEADRREFMPPGLPDFMYTDESPAPRPPLPPPWDHAALRKRYNSSYQEYIEIFSHLVSQKSQIQGMLSKDPDAEKNTDMMLYPDELAKLAGEHKRLKDELECIKATFLNGKVDGGSPRSD